MNLEVNLVGCKSFKDSPDAGVPECLCSKCGELIDEDECPIRLFIDEGRGGEYRFHDDCFKEVSKPELSCNSG